MSVGDCRRCMFVTSRNEGEDCTRWHAKSAWIANAGTQGAFASCKAWPIECKVDDTSEE